MTRFHVFRAFVAAGLAIFIAAGCQQPDLGPAPGMGDPYPAPMNDPQITVLAQDLRPWLGFHPAIVVEGGNGTMNVQLPVRNLSERQLLVDYRILFYDGNGVELEPPMSFRMIALGPKQTVRMSGNSFDNAAASYRVEVKWSR